MIINIQKMKTENIFSKQTSPKPFRLPISCFYFKRKKFAENMLGLYLENSFFENMVKTEKEKKKTVSLKMKTSCHKGHHYCHYHQGHHHLFRHHHQPVRSNYAILLTTPLWTSFGMTKDSFWLWELCYYSFIRSFLENGLPTPLQQTTNSFSSTKYYLPFYCLKLLSCSF